MQNDQAKPVNEVKPVNAGEASSQPVNAGEASSQPVNADGASSQPVNAGELSDRPDHEHSAHASVSDMRLDARLAVGGSSAGGHPADNPEVVHAADDVRVAQHEGAPNVMHAADDVRVFASHTSASAAASDIPAAPRPNQRTRRVYVGDVPVGGGAPCAVQSMLNLPLENVEANLAQIERVAQAGCDIIRIAIPHASDLDFFEQICARSVLPVVADIHFSADLAIEAARRGAAKLRINPGNIGGLEATIPVLDAAREAGIPIRIGVNAGSLDAVLRDNATLTLPQKLAASARGYVEFCEAHNFTDLVVSAKAHDVPTTIETYRILSCELPHIPLHIGVTEAGTLFQGLIKSASGLGILLEEGIGDTMRISLTDDPVEEVRAAWMLLGALDLRLRYPELISCPTCGRCKVDLIALARQVEARLATVPHPLRVAVMGCVVNGPGEAKDADIGVACGDGVGVIFAGGDVIKKVPESQIVDQLFAEIDSRVAAQ